MRVAGSLKKFACALCFLIGGTVAGVANDCVLPKFDPQNLPTSGEEHRALVVGLTEYKLCIALRNDSAAVRVKFPGQAEMLASYNDRLKLELKLWRDRKSIPSLAQYRDALAAEDLLEEYTNYAVSLNIAEAMYVETDLGIPSPYLDQMRAEGKDPAQVGARLSASTRFPPPKAWFTVNRVEISRTSQDVELERVASALAKATKRYKDSKAFADKFKAQVDDILSQRRELIKQSEAKVLKFEARVRNSLEPGAIPDQNSVEELQLAQKSNQEQIDGYLKAEADLNATWAPVKADLKTAEQQLSEATLNYLNVKNRFGGLIKSIQSKDARLVPISEDEQRALRNIIEVLDAEIDARSKAAFEKDKERMAARDRFKQAIAETSNSAEWLAYAGIYSTIVQAHLELQSSALNLALATKGGPTGVLAEATSQFISNKISPPNYYDASGIGRDLPIIKREDGRDNGPDDPFENLSMQDIKNQAIKEVAAIPFRTFNAYAKMNKTELAKIVAQVKGDRFRTNIQSRSPLYSRTINLPQSLASQIAKQEDKALKAAVEFGEATGKAGLWALTKSIGRDIRTSVAKELTKEALKKAAAELIEGGFLRDYMVAQFALNEAYVDFTTKSDLYWKNEEAIATAQGNKEGFIERLKEGDLIVEKSDAFFPLPGYQFVLELEPHSSIDPRKFDADFQLGDVKLIRDSQSTELAWIIPEGAEFGLDVDEELPITITIK